MARKRTNVSSRRSIDRKVSLSTTARLILFNLFQAAKPLTRKALYKNFSPSGKVQHEFSDEIDQLLKGRLIETSAKSKLSLNKSAPFYTATLEMKPAGFGFGIDLRRLDGKKATLSDTFINRSTLFSARHGDRVLVLVNNRSRRRNPEADVLGIVQRGST
ncbi:MAG: hypothetical protein P8X39_12455, partial [Desulfofustis sp.]